MIFLSLFHPGSRPRHPPTWPCPTLQWAPITGLTVMAVVWPRQSHFLPQGFPTSLSASWFLPEPLTRKLIRNVIHLPKGKATGNYTNALSLWSVSPTHSPTCLRSGSVINQVSFMFHSPHRTGEKLMTLTVLAREATQLDSSLHNRKGTLHFYSTCKKEKEYTINVYKIWGGGYFISRYMK